MHTFITTPIYYVNDVPHIGHAYTTFIADMLKKYHQLKGENVFFLTGTDEHGQKIEQSAQKNHQTPQVYVDAISKKFQDLWDIFGIDYDAFIRTTHPQHIASVQKAFEMMYQKGDIYKGEYEGNYCISCESFFASSQIQNNQCPDCGKQTNRIKEESYFFALSKYQDALLEWYQSDCILPRFRKNEVINFVKNGLHDLSITRTSFAWGIKLPSSIKDDKHIVYVWLDALMNYVSALGYGTKDFCMQYWENAIHIVGKDILRFHAIYWPAFLLSLNLPLPKKLFVHGWWLIDGVKMSKSLGNVVDPRTMAQDYGVDLLRYFLLREVQFGQDGDFSQKAFVARINADLANDLGNLLNRLLGMAQKYANFALKCKEEDLPLEMQEVHSILDGLDVWMQEMQPSRYLEELWKIFVLANGMVTKYEPWNLIKQGEVQKVQGLLVGLCNILIKGSLCLYPIMPDATKKILEVFSLSVSPKNYEDFVTKKLIQREFVLKQSAVLFPKIEIKECQKPKDTIRNEQTQKEQDCIELTDFTKLNLHIGTIVEAVAVAKSQKLLKLQVDLGEGRLRQILSGIAEFYDPKDLLGRQVCVLSNLAPRKLMGEISEGMILAVKDCHGLSLLSVDATKQNGSKVS